MNSKERIRVKSTGFGLEDHTQPIKFVANLHDSVVIGLNGGTFEATIIGITFERVTVTNPLKGDFCLPWKNVKCIYKTKR